MTAVEDAVERAENLEEWEAVEEMTSCKDSLEQAEMVDKVAPVNGPNCLVAASAAGAVEMGLSSGNWN